MRTAGVLLPLFSLPSKYGIGDMGNEAYQFVDYLKKMKMKTWQILPLNPVGYGNSPYQPYSSFAGENRFISLDKLVEIDLLKQKDLVEFNQNAESVDYATVLDFKLPYLKSAFINFKTNIELMEEYKLFLKTNKWVENYAVFIAFKEANELKSWLHWPKEHKNWINDKKCDLMPFYDAIEFTKFCQFIFQKQWLELKAYANQNNINIMGDIPIYVGIDSVDVWENQKYFLLDINGEPTHVAGVPPDYFSAEGQRWGNPLYDWRLLEKDNFSFWINRLEVNQRLFDIIRIDHFRAFDTYWKIPSTCPTAIEGEWCYAPGYKLFDEIYQKLPTINLVAEDLGDLRPEVLELRDHYNLKGMKILQFTFDPNETNNDFADRTQMIAYTGTHDNQTINGWFDTQGEQLQKQILGKLEDLGYQGTFAQMMVNYTFDNLADDAIIQFQDLIELGDEARLNTPGTLGSPNWEWKLVDFKELETAVDWVKKSVVRSKRD